MLHQCSSAIFLPASCMGFWPVYFCELSQGRVSLPYTSLSLLPFLEYSVCLQSFLTLPKSRVGEERQIIYLLVHSPGGHKDWGWAGLKPEARNSLVSHVGGRGSSTLEILPAFTAQKQEAGS